MKVLLCDNILTGHRKKYIMELISASKVEFFCCLSENIGIDSNHFFWCEIGKNADFARWVRWICQIRDIIKENGIDIIHFLDGDSLLKFFGIGLQFIDIPILITYHHFFNTGLKAIQYMMVDRNKRITYVVHTDNIKDQLRKICRNHIEICAYPAFSYESITKLEVIDCKKIWNVPAEIPVIGIIGGMQSYKNILPFLQALKNCVVPFHLLICGREGDISEREILCSFHEYEQKVTCCIRQLSDMEYEEAIVASDIIFCAYSKVFDGASGPMIDGICAGKMILACAHGSLGQIVKENQLGYVIDTESEKVIARDISDVLRKYCQFSYGARAKNYRSNLMPEKFSKRYYEIYEFIAARKRSEGKKKEC